MAFGSVTKEELFLLLGNPEVVVVNTLPRDWFEKAHIAGSISMPAEELPYMLDTLPKDKLVVAYCAGPECTSCVEAAGILADKGFNVKVYRGGTQEWMESGLPCEGTSVR